MSDIIERLWGEDKQKVFDEGFQQGVKEGRKRERSDLLNTLLKNGMPPENLSKYLNINISEIKELYTVH